MPVCDTKYFGEVEYAEDALIRFPCGLAGFENETAFLVLSYPHQYPLVYIQSLTTAELCFLALPVLAIDPGYRLQLDRPEADLLSLPEQPAIGTDALCLALITPHGQTPTANLLAPVVVNLHSRVAAQCIHADGWYSHQHPLLIQEEAVAI